MQKKIFIWGMILGLAFLLPVGAQAALVDMTLTNVTPRTPVKAHFPSIVINGVWAGLNSFTIDGVGSNIAGFCVEDQSTTLGAKHTYELQSIGEGSKWEKAAYIANLYLAGSVHDAITAAAAQLAIWEIAIETAGNPYNVYAGNMFIINTDPNYSTIGDRARRFINAATSADLTTFDQNSWSHAVNRRVQDFLVHTPTPTPIPAAAWLLGTGLVGLVVIRRKYK